MNPRVHRPAQDEEYEDLLGLWADLESTLSILLAYPLQAQNFVAKVRQCDRWLQDLVARDIDAALYLMFQLASTSSVGYSTSHALVCATLCHIMAAELALPLRERNALVRAALTMNLGMTVLQDQLATQQERPNATQQEAISQHPEASQTLLERLYVTDHLWLDLVGQHHLNLPQRTPLAALEEVDRLTRILNTIDRYAAMISPRHSRPGRSATDSVRALVGPGIDQRDEVGYLLVRSIGLCPPGTFVRLENGDTAIVLRRSDKANLPLVASLADQHGKPYNPARLHQTADSKPRIQSSLPRESVMLELNHRTMVRVGLYAAQHSTSLVTQPGSL